MPTYLLIPDLAEKDGFYVGSVPVDMRHIDTFEKLAAENEKRF
ncbi:hypothetical protein [Mesorhizobium sp. BR115XR7A]|nr:hypothetical protein [Mesorhizobium sp. BR115XR7A]